MNINKYQNLKTIVSILFSILFTFFLVFYFVYSSPGTTTIGEDISTTNLNVSGNASISNNLSVSQNSTTTNLFVTNLATLKELIVSQTTTFNGVSYNWPSSAGSNGQVLTTDGSGNLSWSSSSAGISGSGTSNFLAKWIDATTLSTSTLYELNGKIGLNTTTPAYTLDINGTLSVSGTSTLSTTTISKLNNVIIVDGIHYEKTSAGIQAAINALPSTGGKIFLPAGTYSINSTTTIPSNVWIEGAGASSTILYLQNNSNCTVFTNSDHTNGNSNIKISNLKIDGNKDNNTGTCHGIWFYNVSNSKIENTYIYNVEDYGIYVYNSSATNYDNNVISNNIIDSNYRGIQIETSKYNILTNNVIKNNSNRGLVLYGGTFNTASNNIIRNNGDIGLLITGNNNTITGNIIEHNTKDGIQVLSSRNTIVGNMVRYNGNPGASGNDDDGIYVSGGIQHNIISSNECLVNDRAGIYVSSDYNLISSNRAIIESGQEYGIYISTGSDYNHLVGNYAPVSDFSTTTIYGSQLNNNNLIFKSSGNIGFGTTTPDSFFQITAEANNSTSTLIIGSGNSKACLKLRDSDKAGWTYCDVLDGSLNCTTTNICD